MERLPRYDMRAMLRAIIHTRSAGLGAGREAGRPCLYMVTTIMIRTYLVFYRSDLEIHYKLSYVLLLLLLCVVCHASLYAQHSTPLPICMYGLRDSTAAAVIGHPS